MVAKINMLKIKRIISVEEFNSVFLKTVKDFEENLFVNWYYAAKFTKAILDIHNSVIAKVADELKLQYFREYYTLDGILYEEASSVLTRGTYVRSINVALEHENDFKTSYIELNKLCLFNAPLKVLITYPLYKDDIGRIIPNYNTIVKESDTPDQQKYLVIFGLKDNDKILWQSYVYKESKFQLKS